MSVYQKDSNRNGNIGIVSCADRVDAIQRMDDKTFTGVLVYNTGMRKSIILNLVRREFLFTEINYGSGVYRILLEKLNKGEKDHA